MPPKKQYVFLSLDVQSSLSDAAPEVDALRWVQVLPLGTPVMNDDRKLRVDAADLAKVFSNATARLSEIPILYEHGWGPHGGEAAGWITKFEVRSDGLYALVKWTASAAAEIREGKWKYLSPGFMGYVDEDGFIRPRTLFEVSLTNTPAIDGMAPVEAAAVWLATPIDDEPRSTKEAHDMDLKKLALSLKLKEDATEADTQARIDTLLEIEAKAKAAEEPETVTLTAAEMSARVTEKATELAARREREKAAAELLSANVASGKIVAAKKDAYATVINAFPAEMKIILEDVGRPVPTGRLFSAGSDVRLPDAESDENAPGFMDKVVKLAKRTGLDFDTAKATLLRK